MRKSRGVFATILFVCLLLAGARWFFNSKADTPSSDDGNTIGTYTNVPSTTQALTKELNRVRKPHGSSELVEDSRLIEIAELRVKDMLDNDYFAHKSREGLLFNDYLELVGLPSDLRSCENLLLINSELVSEIVDSWMNSLDHRKCVLDKGYERVGTASLTYGSNLQQDNEDTVLFVAIFSVDP